MRALSLETASYTEHPHLPQRKSDADQHGTRPSIHYLERAVCPDVCGLQSRRKLRCKKRPHAAWLKEGWLPLPTRATKSPNSRWTYPPCQMALPAPWHCAICCLKSPHSQPGLAGHKDGFRCQRQSSEMLLGGENNLGQGRWPPHSSLSASSPFPLLDSFLSSAPFRNGDNSNGRRLYQNKRVLWSSVS